MLLARWRMSTYDSSSSGGCRYALSGAMLCRSRSVDEREVDVLKSERRCLAIQWRMFQPEKESGS